MKDISTLKGIVDFALEKEAESEGLYKNLVDRVDSPRTKDMFAELAREESNHYRALRDLDIEHLDEIELKDVADLKISDSLHETSYAPDMTYQDILVMAMKNEQHSHSLYQGLADNTDDADLKKLFELLAKQEARHKLRLETEYDEFVLTED